MKTFAIFLTICLICLSSATMRADGLSGLGTSVSGSITFNGYGSTNYFDKNNNVQDYVPNSGYSNSAGGTTFNIAPTVSFGFQSSADLDTALFTGSTLTVSDTCIPFQKAGGCINDPFQMTFTDSAFTGFSPVSNTLGMTYTFSGDTVTLKFPSGVDGTAVLDYTSSVPEPASLTLMATGILGAAGAIRRRFRN